jgi:hypothetical protein
LHVAIFRIVVTPKPNVGLISERISRESPAIGSLLPVINRPCTVVQESMQGMFKEELSLLEQDHKNIAGKKRNKILMRIL